jgi:hypothetical protein
MKYKYIGSEKQLVEHGFRLVLDNEIKAIKPTERSSNVFVDNNNKVMSWRKEDIQDLIDAGLVEEIDL